LRITKDSHSQRLSNINAEDFNVSELPPKIPDVSEKLIGDFVFVTNTGIWWELKELFIPGVEHLYFRMKEPQRVPGMKCTIKDGVFMAIPSQLLDKSLESRFQKLIGDGTEKTNKKGGKKKKTYTESQIYNMNRTQLENTLIEYGLDPIDFETNDLEREELQDLVYDELDKLNGLTY
jgi:hypothetical protein